MRNIVWLVSLFAMLPNGASAAPQLGHFAPPSIVPRIELPAAKDHCPQWPAGTGLLPDGDFHHAADPGSSVRTFHAGHTFAPGWTVSRGSVDFYGSSAWGTPAPSNVCTVDLDGKTAGGIESDPFATDNTFQYSVTFLLSGNGRCGPPLKTLEVRAAGQSAKYTWNVGGGNDAEHGVYQAESFSFTAQSSSTQVEFISRDKNAAHCGPVVAAVSVAQE